MGSTGSGAAAALSMPQPMEARLVAGLPEGANWCFEPKWDGFRALAARDGEALEIVSKSGKPLLRYFPEIGEILLGLGQARFVVDGELILPLGDRLSFDALQQRLHPAASRVARLARETPAQLMLFDCLRIGDRDLAPLPFAERRQALEAFVAGERAPGLCLSPITRDAGEARRWLARSGGALDGIVAKDASLAYRPGERAMLKLKQQRTADCVVGGFRRAAGGVASLLLGLHDAGGRLDYVGFCSSFSASERRALLARLEPLIAPPGFTGKAPGGPSRWRTEAVAWEPLRPELVAEVRYDQVTADRFRHGTTFVRWRPDKAARQCGFDQLVHALAPAELGTIVGKAGQKASR